MASELILSRAPWILNKDGTFVTTPPDTPITPPSSVTMPSTSVFAEEGQESEKVESHSAVPSGALANESVVYPEPVQCLSVTPSSAISAQFEEEVVRQPGNVPSLNIQPLTTYEPLQFTKSDVNQVSWAEHFRYGFPIKEDEQWVKSEAVWWAKYRLQISTWEARWINALNAYNSGRLERISALRTGVPATLRSRVWCALSGIAQRASESEGFVKMTLDLEHVILSSNVPRSNDVPGNGSSVAVAAIQEHFDAIEKDVYRTFTEHPYFQVPGEGHLIVRDVLRALVWRNPLVGYCQSYNYIASVLVVVHRNVDLVFWSMCHLVEHVLPTDYFAASLHGTVVDQEVILDLIVDHCPKVHTHFATHGIDIRPLLPGWTMTLFVNVFPLETTLRIWDTLFLDSDASTTPLRVVLAMVRLHHDLIVACDDAASVMITLNECASSFFDVDRLLNSVATIKLTPIQLTALRQQVRQRMRGGSALTTGMEFCSSMNSPENMSAFSASSSAGSMNLNVDPEGSKRRGRTASISLSSFTACIMAKPAQVKEGSSRFWNALVNSFPNDNTTSRSLNSVVEEENS